MGNGCYRLRKGFCVHDALLDEGAPERGLVADEVGEGRMNLDQARSLMSVQERYEVQGVLGEGQFENVCLARDSCNGNKLVAIKFVATTIHGLMRLKRTLLSHRKLQHPHIVGFQRFMVLPGMLCIIMDYSDGGTLAEHMEVNKTMSEEVASQIFLQVVTAVEYCRQNHIRCQEIAPCSILLSTGVQFPTIKLSGFGYSRMDRRCNSHQRIGPRSCGHRTVKADKPDPHYSEQLEDNKACGVLLFEMLFGCGSFRDAEAEHGIHFPRVSTQAGGCQSVLALDKVGKDCKEILMGLLGPNESGMSLKDVLNSMWAKRICASPAWRKNQKALISCVLKRAHSGEIQTQEEISKSVASCSFGSFEDLDIGEHLPWDQ